MMRQAVAAHPAPPHKKNQTPPSLLSLVNNDTGKNLQGKPNHTRARTPNPPKTPTAHPIHPKTSTHVDKNQAKTPTKQPPDKHENPAHHNGVRETNQSIQFTRCGAATLRSQHPTNRLRHHANPATSRRRRHATEYAQQHRTHRVTVSARHTRRHRTTPRNNRSRE